MTFRVNDKVKYVGSITPEFYGLEGKVVAVEGRDSVYVFFNDDNPRAGVLNSSLTLIRGDGPTGTILDEAKSLVYGNRGTDYGHPAEDYAKVAKIWTGVLRGILKDGEEVTPLQAIQCMIGVKLSRLSNTPTHHDSWVDIAGYAECGNRVVKYQAGDTGS